MSERKASDFYPTPASAILPLMEDMIVAGEAKTWARILDLGCGDGRLARSAGSAYSFTQGHPMLDPYLMGVESDVRRADIAQQYGMQYIWCMTLDEWMPLEDIDLRADLIIANPPFSLAQEFLECALRIREASIPEIEPPPTVAFLLRLNFMGSQKRYHFWNEAERPKIRVLSERPSFTGGGTDMTDYAWFIWTDRDIPALDWYAPQG
jgi:hypothetical protein